MYKEIFLIFLFLISLSGGFSARIIEPNSEIISQGLVVAETIPGAELDLIFSKEFGKYSSIVLESKPSCFDFTPVNGQEAVKFKVSISNECSNGVKEIVVKFFDSKSKSKETFNLAVIVDSSLLSSSVNQFYKQTNTGEAAEFYFTFLNNSDSDAEFIVNSNLPNYWFAKKYFVVPAKSHSIESVLVTPFIEGKKDFTFAVNHSLEETVFPVELFALPTIQSKMYSSGFGLAVYSFPLFPSYLINSLIGLTLNQV